MSIEEYTPPEDMDPDAKPHGDFDPDDLVTDEDDPGPEDAEPVELYSEEDKTTFTQDNPEGVETV